MSSEGISPGRKYIRVLECLMRLSGRQPDVFHDFGRVAVAMGWNGLELGRALLALKDAGDVQLLGDTVALTDAGVTHAIMGA